MVRTLFLVMLSIMSGLAGPAFSKSTKLLIGGSGNPRIYIVDKADGSVEWSHEIGKGGECNSLAVTKGGDILYSYRKGARLVTRDGRTVWDFKAPAGTEIQMAGVLPGGRFVVGRCGFPAVIFELDKKGRVRDSIVVDIEQWGKITQHGQFRQFIRNDKGNYILPVHAASRLVEIGRDGTVLKDFGLGKARPFSVTELPSGNYIVPCGDSHYIVELDGKTGEVVRKIDKIEGVNLQFMAQVVCLENGNLLICNWGGHSGKASGTEPQLIEIDAAGNVVWKLDQFATTGNVSAVHVFED